MKIKIRVNPGSSQNKVTKMADGTLKVNVKTVPEKGEANEKVRKILSQYYGVKEEIIKIISGKSSRFKWVEIKY